MFVSLCKGGTHGVRKKTQIEKTLPHIHSYTVMHIRTNTSLYLIEQEESTVTLATPGEGEEPSAEPLEGEFVVEEVMAVRKHGKKTFFEIKWLGWSSSHNTWEPEENLLGDTKRYVTTHAHISYRAQ